MEHEHDFEVIEKRSADTWRMRCTVCKGVFDLQLTPKPPTCCDGYVENGKVWHRPYCSSVRMSSVR